VHFKLGLADEEQASEYFLEEKRSFLHRQKMANFWESKFYPYGQDFDNQRLKGSFGFLRLYCLNT
jgi:hypothetical protein